MPRGKRMQLSPKARLIRDDLRSNMDQVTKLLCEFVPIATREERPRVTISAPEHVFVALPSLLRSVLNVEDSNVQMMLTTFRQRKVFDELLDDEVDLAISTFGYVDPSLERQVLYTEAMNVTMRKDHPAVASQKDGRISLEALKKYRHVAISPDDAEEDSLLAALFRKRGIDRKVEVVLASVYSLPTILNNSDLICMGTDRGGLQFEGLTDFVRLRPAAELECDTFDVELIWRRDKMMNPELLKARDLIATVAADMPPISQITESILKQNPKM